VHINAGVAALACAIYLGRRKGWPKEAALPHNVPFTVLGAGILWFGWFGFNGGSPLNAQGLAVSAFIATQFGAPAALIGWALVERLRNGDGKIFVVAAEQVIRIRTGERGEDALETAASSWARSGSTHARPRFVLRIRR
jgi:Amt family ammonium transporter